MIAYPIGTQADYLIAVNIRRGGFVLPQVRCRMTDGAMTDMPGHEFVEARSGEGIDFVVSVEPDHSGVVELVPAKRNFARARTVIPLGIRRPFLASEMPPSPGADGAFSFSDRITFHLERDALTWRTENMSGQVALNPSHPELSVVLRLAAGSNGAITFSIPLAIHADGRTENVVSVT